MSKQLLFAAAGAAIGAATLGTGTVFLGLSGTSIGWMAGSVVGGLLTGSSDSGLTPGDLSAPSLSYGDKLIRFRGRYRMACHPVWVSEATAHEQTTEVGKGSSEQTTGYTYSRDVLMRFSVESPVAAITRVWVNKTLVYCALAGADEDTLAASATTDAWASMELLDGNLAQLPWPVYEAQVGSANAIAYRGSQILAIEAINCGSGTSLPLVEVEACTSVTSGGIIAGVQTWWPDPVELGSVVQAICAECADLDGTLVDVTEMFVGGGSDHHYPVTGFAWTEPRAALEQLSSYYHFECECTDKLYFHLRGADSAVTIPFGDLGASNSADAPDSVLDLERGNEQEIPMQVQLKYLNISDDYDTGTACSTRHVGVSRQVRSIEVAVADTPEQALASSEAINADALIAAVTTQVAVPDYYIEHGPCSVVTLTDEDDSTYRVRVQRETWSNGIKQWECVLDDAAALATEGVAGAGSAPSITVSAPHNTVLQLLDVPLLRDADDGLGFYSAVESTRTTGAYPGAVVLRSLDDTEYLSVAEHRAQALIGTCSTVLGSFAGGWRWDEESSVTVALGTGSLASSTKAAMQANRSLNVAAIGAHGRWEIVRYRAAALVSGSTYVLSGLLRGCLGSEQHIGTHAADDAFVLLTDAVLRRIAIEPADLAASRYYKGVTSGRALGTAEAQTFAAASVGSMPWAPVRLRGARDGWGNLTLSWTRRTRLQVRYGGASGGYYPLGEASEAYDVEIYSDDTYSTVLRRISTSSPAASYSAADQLVDGITPGDTVHCIVYQVSAVVGRGYSLIGSV